MITASHLRLAPGVALVVTFLAVFLLGRFVVSGPPSTPDPPSPEVNTVMVEQAPDGRLHVNLGVVRSSTKFAEHDFRPFVVDSGPAGLEVCMKIPADRKIARGENWTPADQVLHIFCTKPKADAPVEVELERR